MAGDGCTYWFDGSWRHCCDIHDIAYNMDAVTRVDHIALGQCVAQTTGGLLMGVVMMVGTTAWWLLKKSNRAKRPPTRDR